MPRRRTRPTTLASLAAELGVSRTTVSNAYNHPEQLSAGLRTRILAAARARGYAGPDPAARSLRTRRTGAIGVVLTEDLTYAFEDRASVDFLAGVAEQTAGSRTSLTLIPVGADATATTAPVAAAVVDGFLVYSVAEDDPHLAAALDRRLPVVVCGQPGGVAKAGFVGLDERAAIRPAARALTAAGHRRVGVLAIRLLAEPTSGRVHPDQLAGAGLHIQRDRVRGVLDELAAVGVAAADVPVVTRHINDPANAYDAAAELMGRHPELTAVVCTTDSMAFGLLAWAADHDVSVPRQLSVTGFDGVERALDTGLSTVVQPNVDKGRTAARLLGAAVEDHLAGRAHEPERVILPTRFSPGTTIAPPRA